MSLDLLDSGPVKRFRDTPGGVRRQRIFDEANTESRPPGDLAAVRVAYVACLTGARTARERTTFEPIEWLLSRRQLFEGRRVIDACQEEVGFNRAVVLHGLGQDFDAAPERMSGIPASAFLSSAATACLLSPSHPSKSILRSIEGELALYSCSISAQTSDGHVQIFCAMVAPGPMAVRWRLRQRYGAGLEGEAIVRLGFDWSEPLACAMVSEAMAHVLFLAEAEPTSSFAEGLDFQVEQRFAS